MGGEAALGNLVHALGADLDFDPFVLRTHDGDVEALVAVRLRDGNPILEALRVRLVHIRDDGIDLPALGAFAFERRVEDDADGEEVVDVLELDLLLLELIIYRMYRLGAAFDFELEARLFQLLLDRGDELGDVGVARTLRLVQLLLDEVELLAVGIFERQILQFALDGVETQAMGEGRVEVSRFGGEADTVFLLQLLPEAHEAEAVGNHQEDDADILGKGEEQMVEVLRIDRRVAGVEVGRLQEAANHERDFLAEKLLDFLDRDDLFIDRAIEQEGDDRRAAESDFDGGDEGGVDVAEQAVDAVFVSSVAFLGDDLLHERFHLRDVVFFEERLERTHQQLVFREELALLFRGKKRFFSHDNPIFSVKLAVKVSFSRDSCTILATIFLHLRIHL